MIELRYLNGHKEVVWKEDNYFFSTVRGIPMLSIVEGENTIMVNLACLQSMTIVTTPDELETPIMPREL